MDILILVAKTLLDAIVVFAGLALVLIGHMVELKQQRPRLARFLGILGIFILIIYINLIRYVII